jgi:hypothetical protein
MRQVGSDRVFVSDAEVVIYAAQPMDWPLREFCRMPIYFEGRKYYLSAKRDAPSPYAKQYELSPWPVDLHEESPNAVIYSEPYVLRRDTRAFENRRQDLMHTMLLPFYPFLGLFWSEFKERAFPKLGFATRSITSASIMLVFCLLVLEGVFVGWLGTGILVWVFQGLHFRTVDWWLTLLLTVDTTLRYSQSLDSDTQRHWGFCEWLWPVRRGKD